MISQEQLGKSNYGMEKGLWKFQELRQKLWAVPDKEQVMHRVTYVGRVSHTGNVRYSKPRNTISLPSVLHVLLAFFQACSSTFLSIHCIIVGISQGSASLDD